MIWSHLVAAAAGASALGAAYFAGLDAGRQQVEAAAAREERLAARAADQAASAAGAAIARIRITHTTIRQEAEREIQTRTEYRDCSHGADQLQRINAALSAPAQPGADRAGVPASDAAGR